MIRTPPLSQRAEPPPLWLATFPKRRIRRGTTRISRVRYGKAKRGCASRVPLAWRNGAPHERGAGGESDPHFFGAGAPRGRTKVAAKVAALCPPCREVALSTVIPGGKAIEPARRPEPGTAEPGSGKADRSSPTATTGTRRTVASTPDVRRVEPHGCQLAEGFVSSRSVAIPLSTHPFTARKVHRNPIQNGGCNEGNSSAMERVSYLYK